MLTRCPHCRTVFRVTAGQLKARAGRVRCGRCATAFDALQMLIEDEDVGTRTPDASSRSAPTAPQSLSLNTADDAGTLTSAARRDDAAPNSAFPEDSLADPSSTAERGSGSAQRTSLHAECELPAAESETGEPVATVLSEPMERREPVLDAAELEPSAAESPGQEQGDPETKSDEELIRPPSDTLENFLQEPPPPRRWPWLLGSLLAMLALLGQALLAWRVELAALYPQTKPLLVQLCAWVGCEVSLPRRSELLSIDSSSLHPGPGGRLELVATLRNRATFAQHYPHLEVTLTDTADRAVVRRAFAPAEWLPAGTDPAAGFAARSEVTVELSLLAQDLDPAGYRLYIFHP